MFHIKWAPIYSVPLEKRIQILCVALWVALFVFGPLLFTVGFIYYLFFGNLFVRIICTLYLIFMVEDRNVGDNGGRGSGITFLRKNFIWKYITNYFPVHLIKTADLIPDKNYLFAIFPHGIVSYGAFCNFVSYNSKFREYFPKIRTKLCTLNINFCIPIIRELILSYGMATASANSLKKLLTASNDPLHQDNSDGYTSNAAIVVVGGAQEALYAKPNNYQVELKHRKGFVRLAIMTGSLLVPVFSFGEVDVYDQLPNPPGSRLRRFQDYVKNKFGVSPVLFTGRGFFQYSFGLIPQRKPITTVVGAPIAVIKNEKPEQEEIDKVHEKFVDALLNLFDTHKHKYIKNAENTQLIIE